VATVIETLELKKNYGKHEAVRGINLSVRAGSVCAFLGQNGAGKSSTIKMLLGMIHPSSGTGSILGHKIDNEKETELPSSFLRIRSVRWNRIADRVLMINRGQLVLDASMDQIKEQYPAPGGMRVPRCNVQKLLDCLSKFSESWSRASNKQGGLLQVRPAYCSKRFSPSERIIRRPFLPVRLPCASALTRALRLRWLRSLPAEPGLPLPLALGRAGRCGNTPCRCQRG